MRRGDIYYVHKGTVTGSEQEGGRPAVIVSNDSNNRHSDVVEVVFLTTRPKTALPTHVSVKTSKYPSTALCEQINSISKERMGDYIGRLTTEELDEINEALLSSLGIELEVEEEIYEEVEDAEEEDICVDDLTIKLMAERDAYKTMYEKLLEKLLDR